jgi:starch-binding outer membrane protein, SusD/RagB family
MTTMTSRSRNHGRIVLAAAAFLLAGCEVTNPGPINDENLNQTASHQGLVRGAERRLMDGLIRTAYSSVAMTTREVFPGGDSNSAEPRVQAGALPAGTGDWNDLQEAYFIATDALRRFSGTGVTAAPTLVAQANIWAGYAMRVLSENWCEVVINGGPLRPTSDGFTLAEKHFTDALAVAGITTAQQQAAYAGRAQARIGLKNWAGAASDAAQVPITFRLQVTPDPTIEPARNYAGYYNDNTPYRVFTMKHTFFESYYTQTGDPRVPWRSVANIPYAGSRLTGYTQAPASDGRVVWLQLMQEGGTTHYNPGTPMALARGPEMLLIRAEAILVQTPANFAAALALINQARQSYTSLTTRAPLQPYTATTLAAAWTALKTERHIEGFLQGKRLFDIMRWTRDQTPGTHPWPNWEPLSQIFREQKSAQSSQGYCHVVPNGERTANPNIPDDLVF